MPDIRASIFGLSGAAREVMRCLFIHGPTWDGNIPSKSGRDDLVERGLAERWNGWQWLTRDGVDFAVTVMLFGEEKERRERRRDA